MQGINVVCNLDSGSKGISLPGSDFVNKFVCNKWSLNGETYSGIGAVYWIAFGY